MAEKPEKMAKNPDFHVLPKFGLLDAFWGQKRRKWPKSPKTPKMAKKPEIHFPIREGLSENPFFWP